MLNKNPILVLVAGLASAAVPALAQENSRQDFAVQASGSFVTSTTQNGIRNNANDNAGVLGTYRFFFGTHHGLEADYGYGQNTQNYTGLPGVETHTHEISGAYVFRMPMGKVTPFALAGVSALVFDPQSFAGASSQTRAGFVYGVGADISLTSHVFARAEYRGFLYNSPTYNLPQLAGIDRLTHRAEPSVGFGYRF